MNVFDITILCKVVDNFGDIGVVYRLAKSLAKIKETRQIDMKLRIVVDNLASFKLLCPEIDENKNYQTVNEWEIYKWDENQLCHDAFKQNPPKIILECFQCGRPDWLETLLFDEKVPNIVNIIMLDYLTAEDYAETFHKLQSLTRSARVQKVNFMPGFTNKTGGLLLDKFTVGEDSPSLQNTTTCSGRVFPLPLLTGDTPVTPPQKFNAVFFSYPQNLQPVVKALNTFSKTKLNGNLNILLAKGAGFSSFKESYEKFCSQNESSFSLTELDFLPQEKWDELLYDTPILFIRGEDSLSRACLYGHPFVWNAYPQSEDYQLVKVQALLEKLKPFFSEELYAKVENCWLVYNGKHGDLEKAFTDFLLNYESLKSGFLSFSKALIKNGDLAENLLDFAKEKGF